MGDDNLRCFTMTTIQLSLPDDLAQKATKAGLLSAEAIQNMLLEQLKRWRVFCSAFSKLVMKLPYSSRCTTVTKLVLL